MNSPLVVDRPGSRTKVTDLFALVQVYQHFEPLWFLAFRTTMVSCSPFGSVFLKIEIIDSEV